MKTSNFLFFLKEYFNKNEHRRHWYLILLLFIASVSLVTLNQTKLQVSLLGSTENEVQFTGTTYPFKYTLSWSKMTYADWKSDIDSVSQNYNLDDLKKDMPEFDKDQYIKSLGKTDADSSEYRNTYLIPWKFPYDLKDPYEGSHPGIDIRNVTNAPIYSISNGTVIKVKDSDGTVCIEMPNVNYEDKVQNLYACYLHMNFRTVSEGDVVEIGQQIGGVGEKGFATTPHLHLQIDREDAPFHPYWPFSSQESSDAGLNFVEAVNQGLGLENLKKYTIDPMYFIQTNLIDAEYKDFEQSDENTDTTVDSTQDNTIEDTTTDTNTSDSSDTENDTQDTESATDQIDQIDNTDIETEDINKNDIDHLSIETVDYYPNKSQEVKICTVDIDGNLTIKKPNNDISIELTEGKGDFDKKKLSRSNFINSCAIVTFTPSDNNTDIIEIYAHDMINQLKGEIQINQFEFKDIDKSSQDYKAIEYAFVNGITTGYPDQTFKPANPVTRIESTAFILRTLKWEPETNPIFDLPDASTNEWYSGILAKAIEEKMIEGYPDGTVRLTNDVNGAEYLKIFLSAFEKDIPDAKEDENWYDPYVKFAKEKNLINDSFDPSGALDRATVVQIIYNAKDLI